jgi:diadenosine tetraphosphatase ApaH/serine/threonine PP2A family protein phosphatase
VLTAILSDIHANRQAFEACLAAARAKGAWKIVLLGDYVGYGADPEWVVDMVRELVAQGAVALIGNHDRAVSHHDAHMNLEAQVALEWTRGELGIEQRHFLNQLPLEHRAGDALFVHADASAPQSWNYVLDAAGAAQSMHATKAHVTFCGHVHRPAVYTMSSVGKLTTFVPVTDVPISLLRGRQWLVVAGSVGQPRDGISAASYLIYDDERGEVTFCRAPYDVAAAAAAIRARGLPHWLADRLTMGR